MTAPQLVRPGHHPAQFDALRPDTDLVTITIGGNDINIGDLWLICAQLGPTDPTGDPCQRQVTAGGADLYAQRIAAAAQKVGQVLKGIRQRSPRATVLLVGYLRILPSTTGCYPTFPIARGDVRYVDGVSSSSPPCWLIKPATTAPYSSTPTRGHLATMPANRLV